MTGEADSCCLRRWLDGARKVAWFAMLLGLAAAAAGAQDAGLPDAPKAQIGLQEKPLGVRDVPLNLLKDQERIWTSPARLNESNIGGPALLVLGTTVLMTTDRQVMSSSRLDNKSLNDRATTASNGLLGGFILAPGVFYGMGRWHHDTHATETGLLGAEAMADGLVVTEVLKAVSQRERPTVDGARGRFFQSNIGTGSSFPSNHSMLAWSSAAVIANEYSGPLTKLTAYGLATGVSVTRILSKEHFPSDVLVGSAVGWMIGRYVVHRHRKDWAD